MVFYESQEVTIKIFSFFAGIGCLDLGFEHAGFQTVFANEVHSPFLKAYKYSRERLGLPQPDFGYYEGDAQDFTLVSTKNNLSELMNDVWRSGSLVGFIGGPPCPDFSVGGKNRGYKGDNGRLSESYTKLILEHQPDFFLFENVKGLFRTKKHKTFYEKIKNELKEFYLLEDRLVNAIEYGVPQDRDRIILIGFHKRLLNKNDGAKLDWGRFAAYSRQYALDGYSWPSTNNFVENGFLPMPDNLPLELTVEGWFQKNDVVNHPNADHCFKPRAGLQKFQTIREGDDSKKSYKRLHRWRYSPTAAYGNNEVHLHPYKARRISAAEALAIQSLPHNFCLPEDMTLTNMFKAIGNGVPYLASKGIAQSIRLFLENEIIGGKFSERDFSTPERASLQLR